MADIIGGSIGVQLIPVAKGFQERTRASLRDLSANVRLVIDDKDARTRLDAFTAERRSATVNVDADTGAAEAKIAALNSSARNASGGIGLLTVAAVGLAPALVPVTAAVGGLVAALSAPALATGAGLAGFVGVAGVAVTKTEAINKQIQQLSKQAENATNMKAAKRYQAQAQTLIDSLSVPQKALLTAQDTVGKAFGSLMKSAGPAIFTPLVTGLDLLAQVLPKVAPLINAVSGAFDKVLASISRSVQSGALDKTVGFFSSLAGPSITGLATILGNIAKGFLSMAQASSGLGSNLLGSLERMSASFANIGQSKGFQSFLAYVAQVGPQVASTLGSVVDAVVNIGRALAPLGGAVLSGIKGVADVLANMNPTVLGLIASSIGGIVIGLKGMSIVSALIPAVRGFAASLGLVDAAAAANPVGAIVVGLTALGAAFVYAWTKSQNFRTVVVTGLRYVANFFLDFVSAFVHGADIAFGWIPGIGPKLDVAAKAVDGFKNSVNASLSGIVASKTITITLETRRIDKHGAGNAALNAEHSGGYKIPGANKDVTAGAGSTTATPSLSYDPSLFATPPTTAATAAAGAKKAAKANQKHFITNGKALIDALTTGMKQSTPKALAAIDKVMTKIQNDITSKTAASQKKLVKALDQRYKAINAHYTKVAGTIKTLKDAFADIQKTVASNLTGDLFGNFTTAGSFLGNLLKTQGSLTALTNAFHKLEGWNLSPAFLSQLFQSGGASLILDLANGSEQQADLAASTYSSIGALSSSLGSSIASITPYGASLEPLNKQLMESNTKLSSIDGHLKELAKDIGKEINDAATHGKNGKVYRG